MLPFFLTLCCKNALNKLNDSIVCYRQLDSDIRDNFLTRIENVFRIGRAEASQLYSLLLQCMNHRQSVSGAAQVNICSPRFHTVFHPAK